MQSLAVDASATHPRQAPLVEDDEQSLFSPQLTNHRDDLLRTSQRLFEAPVLLPLSADQQHLIKQLDFFKTWYLFFHCLYISGLITFGFIGLLAMVPNLSAIDAFFLSVSSVCNCGLQSVDVGGWSAGATLFRHLLLLPGGAVITSSFQPFLRIFMLYRVRHVFHSDERDTPQVALLRAKKRAEAHRLYYAAVVCAATPFVYFIVVNSVLMTLLWCFNVSNLSAFHAFCMTLASFHSSIFLPMEMYAGDVAVTGLVAVACALGFTAYPVFLRFFMRWEWSVVRVMRKVAGAVARWIGHSRLLPGETHRDDEEDAGEADEASAALLGAPHRFRLSLSRYLDEVDAAFEEVMTSKDPVAFHPFLFRTAETLFFGFAWCALTLMQAVPFWYEQWDGVLHGYQWPYKIYLSLCQAAVVRFAAASFVPLLECSNAHVAVVILAMYLPPLPISTDRTYRKWRQMFRTSVFRLLTSRLFWLFTGMLLILFAEEGRMRERLLSSRFDITTRTFFEIISAYSGCGLSLSLDNSSVSFVGFTSTFSRVIIAAVIFGGRHRFVDLGIDLGFRSLQSDVHASSPGEVALPPCRLGGTSGTEEK